MQIKTIRKDLLHWYSINKRDLPFRDSKDPYLIWLSEVMLQQTKVETVIPYYNKWIKKLPTLKEVTNSKLSELLKIWEGLGYYARCRNFYKSSIIIQNKYNGTIPKDLDTFRSLPGVGDYTASAVLSIAFGLPYSVIDGNVRRVCSRVLGKKKLSSMNITIIKNTLNRWIDKENPGDFNQAIMELGALVCKPKNPKCFVCPLKLYCKGFSSGSPEEYPNKIKKSIKPHYLTVGGIIWDKNRFYIQKRNNKNMLGGLWEFPSTKVEKGESLKNALKRRLKEKFGFNPIIIKKIGTIKHTYSHFSITLHAYHCRYNFRKLNIKNDHKWITKMEIDLFPFPKANHKIFNLILEKGWDV